MYIVSIQNGSNTIEIQNEHHKLFSGSVVQGINGIDSFTFSILPDNPAFGALNDFVTLVSVYNLARQRYEFQGRVLYTSPQMSDKGLLTQEAVCESYLGFLHDSQQEYVEEQNWNVLGLLSHIIDCHNSQLEAYKHFQLGTVTVTDKNDTLYVGIQRENTWETIKKKLIDVLGGEIRFRQVDGVLYLDYVEQLGELKSTEIALSKNMKSIVKEKNPSAFITRLIPLGAKIKTTEKDDDGNETEAETEQRVDISSVNGGANYIDDTEAIAVYGLHVGYVEFDDVTEPSNVLSKGRAWLKDNNKVSIKYSITALDLSLIGLDADDFEIFNTYPLKNSLLGIDDTGRLHKKNIDVCDDTKTSFEIGESFRSLSELQREQMISLGTLSTNVANIIRNYATNQRVTSESKRLTSLIEQTEDSIKQEVDGKFATKDDLNGYTKESELSTTIKQVVSESGAEIQQAVDGKFATKDDLKGYAKESELSATIKQTIKDSSAEVVIAAAGSFASKDELHSDYTNKYDLGTVIKQTVKESGAEIKLAVEGEFADKDEFDAAAAKLELKVERDGENGVVSAINASADKINLTADRFKLTGNNINLDDGALELIDSDGSKITFGKDLEGIRIESGDFEESKEAGRGAGSAVMVTPLGLYFHAAPNNTLYHPISMIGTWVDDKLFLSCQLNGEWKINRASGLTAITSDRNRKNTIEEQGEVYSRIFDRLRPVTFKYNNGESDRIHTGLIAQEVEEAVLAEGLTTKDFAAVCYDEDENGEKTNYAIRYGELVSMCVKEIQGLKAEVSRLKQANNVTP